LSGPSGSARIASDVYQSSLACSNDHACTIAHASVYTAHPNPRQSSAYNVHIQHPTCSPPPLHPPPQQQQCHSPTL
jgi:hypothetical protein